MKNSFKKLNEHRYHKQLKKQSHNTVSQKERALKEQLQDVTALQNEVVGIKEFCEGLVKTPDHKILSTKIQLQDHRSTYAEGQRAV